VVAYLGATGPVDTALDVCCGTGAGLCSLRPLCLERIAGLDISRGMLDVCRQRAAEAPGTARVDLVRADALAIPFGPEFDVIVSFGAFGHILRSDEPRFAAEIARVLRPGGRFVFVTAPMPSLWSRRYWLSRMFNAAMRVRNWLIAPPFIMYYLTFLLPEVEALLRQQGLAVEVREMGFEGPWAVLRLVVATRPPMRA
jgi:ubiquinone/menaquinone biosynthesis C-methylase UbiE